MNSNILAKIPGISQLSPQSSMPPGSSVEHPESWSSHSPALQFACSRRVLTGAAKWNSKPLDARWRFHHLEAIDRLAASGIKWAHAAKEPSSPLRYLAAAGFTKQFLSAARSSRNEVYCWTLADVFKPERGKRAKTSCMV